MKLSFRQKYSIATMLSNNTLANVIARLSDSSVAVNFAVRIDQYYKKRDGFIPLEVIKLLNEKE